MAGDRTPGGDVAIARRIIGLIDLTDLSDDCTPEAIDRLCSAAITPFGNVPAVCVWPAFVGQAKRLLQARRVLVATVVNFPGGGTDVGATVAETVEALHDGADEIDVVIPYHALLAGESQEVGRMVGAVKSAAGDLHVKAILETGELPDQTWVALAAELAIDAGADFVKTSTGKSPVSATPEAAHTMLEVIKASGRAVGLKPSGGIRTVADATTYLALADSVMGKQWATYSTFRFGASGLLGAALDEVRAG
jgi:deoxyribose-phosphate aldolase